MSQDKCDDIRRALVSSLGCVPLGELTVKTLCREAGIGRATFYRHYGSLEDLVDSVYIGLMDRIGASAGDHGGKGWTGYSGYMHSMFEIMHEERELLLLLHRNGMTDRFSTVLESSFGLDSIDDPGERYSMVYHIGGIVSFLKEWLDRDMVDDPDDIAEMALRIRSSMGRPVLLEP